MVENLWPKPAEVKWKKKMSSVAGIQMGFKPRLWTNESNDVIGVN